MHLVLIVSFEFFSHSFQFHEIGSLALSGISVNGQYVALVELTPRIILKL